MISAKSSLTLIFSSTPLIFATTSAILFCSSPPLPCNFWSSAPRAGLEPANFLMSSAFAWTLLRRAATPASAVFSSSLTFFTPSLRLSDAGSPGLAASPRDAASCWSFCTASSASLALVCTSDKTFEHLLKATLVLNSSSSLRYSDTFFCSSTMCCLASLLELSPRRFASETFLARNVCASTRTPCTLVTISSASLKTAALPLSPLSSPSSSSGASSAMSSGPGKEDEANWFICCMISSTDRTFSETD
mmetsp:Transcript_141247/g.245977  ORF Transcript_141247/g.245977 Transcript_141247/m.245977 type:complete len:248 (-) Transcript_141247:1713-2456(-)